MYKLLKAAVLTCLFVFATPASADGLDSQFKAWNVFSTTQNNEKICYITSSPIKEGGNWKRRSEPYVLVSYRGNGISEVSVSSGYPYKKESKVLAKIDKKSHYNLLTSEETPKIAWAKDAAEDKKIIKSIIKGARLNIKGTSRMGSWSEDTYSLYGFTKAYKRMQALCTPAKTKKKAALNDKHITVAKK